MHKADGVPVHGNEINSFHADRKVVITGWNASISDINFVKYLHTSALHVVHAYPDTQSKQGLLVNPLYPCPHTSTTAST
jgi:hypothetical protein